MGKHLQTATILYVENNQELLLTYAPMLASLSKKLFKAFDGNEALELYNLHSPDIVVMEMDIPLLSGIEVAYEMRRINPQQKIIFTSSYDDASHTLPALELNINAYFVKPFEKTKLELKIKQLEEQIRFEKHNTEHHVMLEQILHNQSTITIVTDFKRVKFASRSLWNLLYVKNWEQFFNFNDSILDLFVEHQNYISGRTAEHFLQQYHSSDADKRLVSIITENGPTAFFISIDTLFLSDDLLYVITLMDVTSLQASRLNALYQATYDGLTKIYNRHAFETHLERELLRVNLDERPLCMALLDIDHFKQFNDTFGHLIGDEILIQLSQEIHACIRKSDIVARWGGEEFTLLLHDTTLVQACELLERIRYTVEHLTHAVAGNITISIGVTQVTSEDTATTLFQRCDAAMYRAKIQGRNRIECS